MPLFWSKKSKAEKIYDTGAVGGKTDQKKSTKSVKALEVVSSNKTLAPIKTATPIMPVGTFGSVTDSILRPRITEKSGLLSQGGVYTFEVSTSANKQGIRNAVRALYKVNPIKVAIVNLPAKNIFVRGRKGRVSGIRKAMITVKKGEKIDFV